ncbi:ASB5 protein, partial [Nyctiprogne leucopyga]|nr:ASB5 protein [Nyctiprogne leucopyga]
VNATTIDGVTPLFNACSRGSAACAELLLEYGAKAQWESCLPSPTHEAASRGHSECLEVLISWGIDVDQDLPHLGTPLYVACVSQQIHCIRKLLYAAPIFIFEGKKAMKEKGRKKRTNLQSVNSLLFGCSFFVLFWVFLEIPLLCRTVVKQSAGFCSCIIKPLSFLLAATPSSLCQLCRLCIRNYIGRARLHLIPQLQLPTILKNFLQYR